MTQAQPASPPDDPFARALRGFGPVGILAFFVIFAGNLLFLPLSAILVLAWAQRTGTPWRAIGYVRPRSWAWTIVIGVVFGIAFKLVMKSIVMPLLGAPPINASVHDVVGNPAALPGMVYMLTIGAGFGEETLFRGYMFERLGKLFGTSARAKLLIVPLSAAWFASAHYASQGLPGVEQAICTGLVFGSIFAVTGEVWMLMFAHAAFDLTALWIIYWNLETTVAHWVFK
jgi:membrane protease YdiL (CAAX protease family)